MATRSRPSQKKVVEHVGITRLEVQLPVYKLIKGIQRLLPVDTMHCGTRDAELLTPQSQIVHGDERVKERMINSIPHIYIIS